MNFFLSFWDWRTQTSRMTETVVHIEGETDGWVSVFTANRTATGERPGVCDALMLPLRVCVLNCLDQTLCLFCVFTGSLTPTTQQAVCPNANMSAVCTVRGQEVRRQEDRGQEFKGQEVSGALVAQSAERVPDIQLQCPCCSVTGSIPRCSPLLCVP